MRGVLNTHSGWVLKARALDQHSDKAGIRDHRHRMDFSNTNLSWKLSKNCDSIIRILVIILKFDRAVQKHNVTAR